MARQVLAKLGKSPEFQLAAIISRTQPEDLAAFEWHRSLADFTGEADLLIDFTLPAGTRAAASWCARHGVALLSGTTGLNEEDKKTLQDATRQVAVLSAPNLSYGVALAMSLVNQAAGVLGQQASTTITDIHHTGKVDAPSGTALALAAAVMEGRSERLETLLEPERLKRMKNDEDGQLDFTSIREGEVVGEHTVRFALAGEIIEITHKALDRAIFAAGALKAGAWLVQQPPGLYTTTDWLSMDSGSRCACPK